MEAGPAEELRQFVARAQVLDSFGWTRRDLLGHTASTQADAWQQVATAGPDYTGGLVVALRQSAGRGRLGRTWDSPAGNLCFSVVSRRTEPPHCSPGWAPLAGLAVAVVLQRYGVPTLVKWPNDVLIHGKKVCGILSEARGNWRVTGIGVNVNSTHHDLPEELQSTATTLRDELGAKVDLGQLLLDLLHELGVREREYLLDGCSLPVREYESRMAYLGDLVRVQVAGGETLATVDGIREDGALWVHNAQGYREAILVGEVLHVRPAA